MTDKKTLDNLFEAQDRKKAQLKILQEQVESYAGIVTSLDFGISQLAENYIFEIVADPNNEKRGGNPVIQYHEIKMRVLKEEPRFTEAHLRKGLVELLSAGKIESDTTELTLQGHRRVRLTIYKLKEDKK